MCILDYNNAEMFERLFNVQMWLFRDALIHVGCVEQDRRIYTYACVGAGT